MDKRQGAILLISRTLRKMKNGRHIDDSCLVDKNVYKTCDPVVFGPLSALIYVIAFCPNLLLVLGTLGLLKL